MKMIKEFIKSNKKASQAIYLATEASVADDISTKLLKSAEIIEILHGSGECADDGYSGGYCKRADSSIENFCKWCQGQEKINKRLRETEYNTPTDQ